MFGGKDQNMAKPMGEGMGMPGPAMAARMMQMMPMMAGSMLSEMSGEDSKSYLFEMVGNLIARSTVDLTDEEYASLVKELTENLSERKTTEGKSEQSCC